MGVVGSRAAYPPTTPTTHLGLGLRPHALLLRVGHRVLLRGGHEVEEQGLAAAALGDPFQTDLEHLDRHVLDALGREPGVGQVGWVEVWVEVWVAVVGGVWLEMVNKWGESAITR